MTFELPSESRHVFCVERANEKNSRSKIVYRLHNWKTSNDQNAPLTLHTSLQSQDRKQQF